ncbi:MFS transporter [Streptomyces platensis]|uniref:MFS transporter n=1 Tax=Streptomyces platensis TaxID=58346 RepID=UPI00369335FA
MVCGPLGDRIGRKRVLAATMIMMAVSAFAVGFLPTYNTVGFAAPIPLLICRLLQGFSTGGECAGATTSIAEYAPDTRRGFLGSWLDFGTFVGYALGSGLVTLLTAALGDKRPGGLGLAAAVPRRRPVFMAGSATMIVLAAPAVLRIRAGGSCCLPSDA